MKQFLVNYKYHLLLILIGLAWLEILNVLLQLDCQNLIYPDSQNYHQSAEKMFLKFTGHFYRPLLMAFITGFPYLLGSSSSGIYQWSFFVNVFCWLGTALLCFEILKHFLSEKRAFWFAGFSFLIVGSVVLNFHLLTENIYVFFIICSVYFLFRYYKEKQFWTLSLALSLVLVSMLIKPGSKFLAIFFCLYFVKEILKNYKNKSILFLYASLTLIMIQLIGMKVQYGNFTISYIDGVTYHNYLFSKAECIKNGEEYNQINNPRSEYLFSLNFTEQKKVALEDLKHQMQFNTINVFKAYLSDIYENTIKGNSCIYDLKNKKELSYFDSVKESFFWISKWQNRVLTVLGFSLSLFFLLKKNKNDLPYRFIAFYILYIMILSGISCGQGDRFHLVTFPFVIILLAKFLM
jgi:hypothetical protein